MKDRFPGFKQCLRMMRKHNGQTQEDGFQWLLPHAAEHVPGLIEEFGKEPDHGLRCWLMELIGSAKSPDAFAFLAEQLRSPDEGVRFWATCSQALPWRHGEAADPVTCSSVPSSGRAVSKGVAH